MASKYDQVSEMVFTLSADEQIKLAKLIRQKAGLDFKKAVRSAGEYLRQTGISEEEALHEVTRLRNEN